MNKEVYDLSDYLDDDRLKVYDCRTEGIRYAGSKAALIPNILQKVQKLEGVRSVLDGFTGTTRVAQAFKRADYNVSANDLAEYSKVFGNCYLINDKPKDFYGEKIAYLNSLSGVAGYFTEHYSSDIDVAVSSDGKKKNWQRKNTMRIDVIRDAIDEIADDTIDRDVLLAALLLAADKVSNNLGHQVSYLRDWAPRTFADIVLVVPNLIINDGVYKVYKKDIMDIDNYHDLVYIDPPYGTNNNITVTTRVRYASYYHIWTTLCKNDKPKVFGAANRREDVSSDRKPAAISDYESTDYNYVFDTFNKLFNTLNTRYIMMSYGNKSKIVIEDLVDHVSSNYKLISLDKISHKENIQKKLTGNKEWLGDGQTYFEYLLTFEK